MSRFILWYSSPSPLSHRQSLVDKGDQASAEKNGAGKLRPAQKELADRFESALGTECMNDAGKWVNRIKNKRQLAENVLYELENTIKETRIKKTPGSFAEDLWQRWDKHQ